MPDATEALKSITPKKRMQYHQSFMSTMSVCQLRAMFRYQLGIRRPPSAYLHVGSAVDASVTQDLQNKIDTGELLKRQDAVDIAAATFEAKESSDPFEVELSEKKEGISKDAAKAEALDKSVSLAGLHYDKAAPVIQPKYVQRSFAIDMDGWLRKRAKQLHTDGDKQQSLDAAKILHAEGAAMNSAARIGTDFAGAIDIIEETTVPVRDELRNVHIPQWMRAEGFVDGGFKKEIVIRDTKTSKRSPSEDSADDSNQLVSYGLATLVLDKKLPDATVLDYLVRTPKRHDLNYVPRSSTVTMDDINVFLFRFARAIHSWHVATKTGAFMPANTDDWHCSESFCGYWDMCPAAKRPHTVAVPKLVQIG
jgi:hypothetical protein